MATPRVLHLAAFAAASLAMAGCQRGADQTLTSPNFADGAPLTSAITVCKIGPAGSTATFLIEHTGTGTLTSGSLVTIPAGDRSCTSTFTAWESGPAGDPDDSVRITEVEASPGVSLDTILAFGGLDGDQGILPPQNWVVIRANNTTDGILVKFKNEGIVGKTFSIGPSSMEGHLKIPINSWFNGGYSFKFKNNTHAATQFTVQARVEVPVTCPYGGGPGGTIVIPLGTVVYNVPAANTNWLPTGDANSILSWMGAVRSPDLCGGFPMDNARGAIFTATVAQNPPTGSLVDFRFKYRDPLAKGKVDTNCTDPNEPKRNDAATCGASWSQTVTDP